MIVCRAQCFDKSLLSLQARVQQLLQINANQISEIQNLQSVVSSNFQVLVTIHFHCFVQTSMIFRVSLVQGVSHLDPVV